VRGTDVYAFTLNFFTLNFGDSRVELPALANPTVLKLIRVNGGLEH
jgi:hypothetical protein